MEVLGDRLSLSKSDFVPVVLTGVAETWLLSFPRIELVLELTKMHFYFFYFFFSLLPSNILDLVEVHR